MLSRKEKEFFQPDPEKIDILEKERQGLDDPDKIMQDYNNDLRMASELKEKLKTILSEDRGAAFYPKEAEKLFMQRQKVMCRIAGRFHPLSAKGSAVLSAVRSDRKEYEKRTGKLIAAINKADSACFSTVLDEDVREAVDAGKYRAIGILQLHGIRKAGVGALAYYYDKGAEDESILRIVWLYIHPDHRRRGCADVLLSEIINVAIDKKVSAITLDFHPGDQFESIGMMLDNWRFTFTPAIETDFVCRIGDIDTHGIADRFSDKVVFLSELEEEKAQSLIKRFLAVTEYSGYIASDTLPKSYIDLKLSCFTGDELNPAGLLLAHKRRSGDISTEFLYCMPEAEDDAELLLYSFVLKASRTSPQDDLLCISVESDEDAYVLDEYFPVQQGNYILGAILQEPEVRADV